MGCRNSIKTRILGENRATYVMGCPCHIVHNTAGKAADAFEAVSVFRKVSRFFFGPTERLLTVLMRLKILAAVLIVLCTHNYYTCSRIALRV